MNQTATQLNSLDQQLKTLDLEYRLYKNEQLSRVNSNKTYYEVHRKLNLTCKNLQTKKAQFIRSFYNHRAASLKLFETEQNKQYTKMIAEIHNTRMNLLKPPHLDHHLLLISPKNNTSYVARHVQDVNNLTSSPTTHFPLWGWIIIGKTKLIDPANTIHKIQKTIYFLQRLLE